MAGIILVSYLLAGNPLNGAVCEVKVNGDLVCATPNKRRYLCLAKTETCVLSYEPKKSTERFI